MATYTPMIQQYLQVKADYQDAFLFFRLGDFYEMFFDDAIKASQELEITLTSRDGGLDERIPMCGVPYHAASQYIEKLIEKGYKVAICEQMEDPKQAKGVVKREVIQLITPGTLMDGKGLNEKENNYISTLSQFDDRKYGFACSDLSTGENKATILEGDIEVLLNELSSSGSKEVVVDPTFDESLRMKIRERTGATISFEGNTQLEDSFKELLQGEFDEQISITVARLFNYLYRTQKRSLDHLQPVERYYTGQFLRIDYFSKRNLELTETIRTKGRKGSLLWLLDETKTAMGGRLLKQWIDRPLINEKEIRRRQDLVETLMDHYFERQEIREKLKEVYDLERLAGRVAFGNANARDLVQLKRSLMQVPHLKELLNNIGNPEGDKLAEKLDPCEEIVDLLERAIVENPPLSVKEGDIIQNGYNEELDRFRDASRNGKSWIAQLEQKEREKTGIKSLKVGYNRVFGYYIEVTKANLHLLKEGQYDRKQTLANAERFITPELKEMEALILDAQEKSVELEYELFTEIRDYVKEYIPRLQALGKAVSELDVLQCLATVSEERHYVRPVFSHDRSMVIKDGRHPVVEKVMKAQEYVPNDCYMGDGREILLITGPNMSGKSTYMRQIALTVILAQIGCFVPASEATLPIFDQVFTRIGASDDLISGQSTFMVEMLEAKHAIQNGTENSLILFDEIGRGTSTYDGMALAQAIIEYIHDHIGAKTLFSTHYHELTALEEELKNVQNIHVSAIEHSGKVVFLHKIKSGPTDKSYGIHVAQLAELPSTLISRAREILETLEQNGDFVTQRNGSPSSQSESNDPLEEVQLSFFEEPSKEEKNSLNKKEKKVIETIKHLEILDMTPMDAINTLYELHKKLKE